MVETYQVANRACGIILNAKTGAVMGMASVGGFDLNAPFDIYDAALSAQLNAMPDGEEKALQVVALPGTSEHQLGLALDIIAEFDADNTATWQWLKQHCAEYGFILRYPADKEEITGISYEPWHFRYVGVEAAREIMSSGVCLEEYLEQRNP